MVVPRLERKLKDEGALCQGTSILRQLCRSKRTQYNQGLERPQVTNTKTQTPSRHQRHDSFLGRLRGFPKS